MSLARDITMLESYFGTLSAFIRAFIRTRFTFVWSYLTLLSRPWITQKEAWSCNKGEYGHWTLFCNSKSQVRKQWSYVLEEKFESLFSFSANKKAYFCKIKDQAKTWKVKMLIWRNRGRIFLITYFIPEFHKYAQLLVEHLF